MATYAIGDIQGCFYAFQTLLERLRFDAKVDQLWLVGDIVNRGSGSLEVLRWCYQHQANLHLVLGNHDLHCLVVANGIRKAHRSDTLQIIFDAPDAKQLLDWLRCQPLMYANDDYAMVHAGLLPQWTIEDALSLADEVQTALQSDHYLSFLSNMYGNVPAAWSDDLTGDDRLRVITNAMTRMRICSPEGTLEFTFKGELPDIPAGYLPWFALKNRQSQTKPIICGHWSALGLYNQDNIYALDTGCLWGGYLTAMCLETKVLTQVKADQRDLVTS